MLELGSNAAPKVIVLYGEQRALEEAAGALKRDYHVLGTTSPDEVRMLLGGGGIAVFVADESAAPVSAPQVLAYCADVSPETVRVLIGGDAAAIAEAVNEGGVFRCVPKSWSAGELIAAARAAAEHHKSLAAQHRLVQEFNKANLRPQWNPDPASVLESSLLTLRLLAAAVENSGEAVYIFDRENRIQYVNRAFEERSGMSRAEAIGKGTDALGERGAGYETAPVCDARGETAFFVCRASGGGGELARAKAELEQFAYVVSHDLQEPLRMVASYTQLLGRRYQGKLDKEADEFIFFAVDGARRMQNMIKELLDYSRVTRKGRDFAPADCGEIVRSAQSFLRREIEETKAEIECEPLPVVSGDGAQIERVFLNLLGNALKFRGPAAPRVRITAERKNGFWEFAVADNGIGIDPQSFERIFVIFQRLHTQAEYPGTGMGLPIAKRIVERHGGRIRAESAPGGGSVFRFTLPAQGEKTPERVRVGADLWNKP